MTAFNIVRFSVKPGYEQPFVDAHRTMRPPFKGFVGGNLVRTGDRTYCFVGEWRAFRNIESARPQMIAFLDELRHMLEDLGRDLGVTDPVSGEAVVKLSAPKARKKAAAKRRTTGDRTRAKTKTKSAKTRRSSARR
jgi:hypothetical protein